MIFLWFLILASFILIFGVLYIYLIKYRDIQKLPGPSLFSTIRNLLSYQQTVIEVSDNLFALNRVYGPVVKLWASPFKPMLIVSDAKYVEFFLTSTVHLDKADFFEFFKPFVGTGLAGSEASLWKKQRKLLNPAFHNKTLETYVHAFAKFGNELIANLNDRINDSFVDVLPLIMKYTLHVICATIFNLNLNLDEKEEAEYINAQEGYYTILVERTMSIFKKYNFLFHLTNAHRKQQGYTKTLNDFSANIVHRYRHQRNSKQYDALDIKHLIDLLLENYDLNDREMRDHIGTFLVAGYDTSATAMGFALYELAKRPELQARLIEESNSIIGEDIDAEPTVYHMNQMKYLHCVLEESMRLYAPVPFLERTTKDDVVIDGTHIPKGTNVTICAYNVHVREDYHPNPKKFDPDRFLPENIKKMKPFTYIPFSSGSRGCIGKPYAMLEMKAAITNILRHFELHPAEGQPEMKLYNEFVLKSTVGIPIRLTPRRHK